MPSFEFIESAIIANLDTGINDAAKANMRGFKFGKKDFARHGDAFDWIGNHFNQYGEFPSFAAVIENFPSLDVSAQSVNFDYAVQTFRDQILTRKVKTMMKMFNHTILGI